MPHFLARILSARRLRELLTSTLAIGLMLIGAPARAMLLGAAQSHAVLGQPLRVEVPVSLDASEQLDPGCVQFEVDAGDQELGSGQLMMSLQTVDATHALIVVRSRTPINEPFVDMTVKIGCEFQRSRQYTLLVDPPAAPSAETEPPPQLTASAPLRFIPVPPPPRASAPRVPLHQPAVAQVRRRARSAAPAPARDTRRGAAHAALKLDWMAAELAPQLRLSPDMAPPAAAVTPAQREQAASLRDAVMDSGANADKMLRMSQQLADLDTKLAALDSWRVQQSRQLAQAQAQAEDAERDRFGAGWVAALGALAALLAMVVAWLWRERQRAQPGHGAWFIPDLPEPLPAAVAAPRAGVDGVPEWQHSGPRTWPPAEVATAPQAEREPARAAPAPAAGAQPAATSDSAPPRAAAPAWGQALSLDKEVFSKPLSGQEQVQVDEMMDSGHLADFFISIGNLDQAIEVMRKALSDRSSGLLALPYLYLFDLYRQTGRQEDYAALLEQFAHRFNVRIPGWDEEVAEEPRDLESYPRAIALICETWDLPPMVTVIERMLLDDPNKPRVGFDLPAYRDLLDLYAVARDLSRNPAPPEFVRHAGPVRGPDELDFPLDLGAATAPVQDAAAADASRAAALPEIAGMAPAASSEIDAAGPARHLPALDFTLDEPAAVGAAPAPAQGPAPDSGAA